MGINNNYKYDIDTVTLMENMFEALYIVDKHRKIVFWNEGCERITGFLQSEVVNSFCYNKILQHVDISGKSLCNSECPLTETLRTGNIVENDVFLHHKEGHRVPVTIKSVPIYENNEIVAAIEVFTDTRYKENQYKENKKLKKLVDLDPLTGVYNRRYIEFQLEIALAEYEQFATPFALLFIDIDHFKNVNDKYGHTTGDIAIKTITNTISANIRPQDYIGRFGGEEFLVLLKSVDMDILQMVSERIRILCEKSVIKFEDTQFNVTISVGAALYNGNEDMNELIHRVDELMYQSKKAGRNRCTIENS